MTRISPDFSLAMAAALAALTALASTARADVAPPPSFEPACTLERAQAAGEPCETCDPDFRDADACARAMSAKGFVQRCRTPGLTAWTEVWCRAPAAAPPASAAAPPAAPPSAPPSASASAPPLPAPSPGGTPEPPRPGCAVSARGAPAPLPAPRALLLAAVALLVRRRSASWRLSR